MKSLPLRKRRSPKRLEKEAETNKGKESTIVGSFIFSSEKCRSASRNVETKNEVKNMWKEQRNSENSLKGEARRAKRRIKSGFWLECEQSMQEKMEKARQQGLNESKVGRFFKTQVEAQIEGKKEDEFYIKVREMLLQEGEVSDAIGRLTDKAYYETLSYEEKQRYTLSLSERYLRALERFRRECEFDRLEEL